MIPSNGERSRTRRVHIAEKLSYLSNAGFIIVGTRKGDVTDIGDLGCTPRIELEPAVHTPSYGRDVAQGAWAKVLISLCRAIPG